MSMQINGNMRPVSLPQPQRGTEPNPRQLALEAGATRQAPAWRDGQVRVAHSVADLFSEPGQAHRNGVEAEFIKQFGTLARDPEAFQRTMHQVFGEGYDQARAERFRQMALRGDYSFLPPVEYVDNQTLRGANGAYDSERGVIYINESLRGTARAAATFVEEAGHHLDAELNVRDSAGDEGEVFRRVLGGEQLSRAQIAAIRSESDKGVITVNGRRAEVEFFSIGKTLKKVGKAVGGAFKKAGEGLVSMGKGAVDGAKQFATGLLGGPAGFFKNIFKGDVAGAFRSLLDGMDKAFLQAPARFGHGVWNGLEEITDGAMKLLGPKVGGWIQKHFFSRMFDVGRQGMSTLIGMGRDALRLAPETAIGFMQNLVASASHLLNGEWSEALGQLGKAFGNVGARFLGGVFDILARGVVGAGDGLTTIVGLAPPSRGLNDQEIALLREVYSDSIDYDSVRVKFGGLLGADLNGRARVVGNHVYLQGADRGAALLDSNGNLTSYGHIFVHEFGHVWQNQNGGGDYIHKALIGQAQAGYNWAAGIAAGQSFSELNPEQQAEYVADVLAPIVMQPGGAESNLAAALRNGTLTAAEHEYALNALRHVQFGTGAPGPLLA